MIIEQGGRLVAVQFEVPAAQYRHREVLTAQHPADVLTEVVPPRRVTVEIMRRFGGMRNRALVGGKWRQSQSGWLDIEVFVAEQVLELGAEASCPSALDSPLVPGLPAEFAPAVLSAVSAPAADALPSGLLRIDRAAHDEVDSSPSAFGLAAGLLIQVMACRLSGGDVEQVVKTQIGSW